MKKAKKILGFTLAAIMAIGGLAGCNREPVNDTIVNDGKTINIRANNQGLGYAFVEEMCKKFNELYKDEGYKANLLAPIEAMGEQYIYQDIYQKSGVDLYVGSADMKGGVDGYYGLLFADLTDSVYNQKPIRFDGTEEDCTVASKISDLLYDNTYNSKYYGLPYVFTVSGMAVNTALLEDVYGLELPRTTNELAYCIEKIMEQAATTNVFPFTYSVGDNTYSAAYIRTWMAQYGGFEEYMEFWSMEDYETGETLEDPASVFGTESIEKMLEEFIRVFDYRTAAYGSESQNYKDAQKQLYRGEAVFYTVSDWLYNEEMVRNESYLEDVEFIRVPMLSSLGTKLFGSGTSYAFDDAKCEAVLTSIVEGADANMSVADIISKVNSELSVTIAEADVKTVCERRNYVFGNSQTSNVFVSVHSEVKDICALFLRMWASDEGASLIAHTMNSNNPFKLSALSDVNDNWQPNVTSIVTNQYMKQLPIYAMGYRREEAAISNAFTLTGLRVHSYVLQNHRVTIYKEGSYKKEGDSSVYKAAAQKMAEDIYTDAKNYNTLK
ncbi:MAG: extracellular solute-binding protein [Clostridia bacterium]|nr:extracellular solute-binding protein [Clostridia bacterium]